MTLKDLREKRARLVENARAVLDTVDAESRSMNADETAQWDGYMSEADGLKATIDRLERIETEERSLDRSNGRRTDTWRTATADKSDALRAWFLAGSDRQPTSAQLETASRLGMNVNNRTLSFDLRSEPLRDIEDRREWEERAQSVGTASEGGNLVPDGFVNQLETALLTFGGIRQVASVIRTVNGQDLPWPTENDTANEGVILAENTQVAEEDLVFGQAVLKAYKYSSKMIRVPVELLQDSAINLPAEIGTRLGERIGRITSKHFTTGTGTGQPSGIITGATLGKTGANGQTTTVTYDDLVDLEHSVDPTYRLKGTFMFADSTLAAIKKLKDSEGRPLWAPGIAVREPDRILGYPYVINQAVPAMAASAKSIVFGDLSKYKVRDVANVTLVRLDERFADFHQVAFLAFSRHDGRLLDAGTNPVKFYANSAT